MMTMDEAKAQAAAILAGADEPSAVECRVIEGGWRCQLVGDPTTTPVVGGRDALVRGSDGAVGFCPVAVSDAVAVAHLDDLRRP